MTRAFENRESRANGLSGLRAEPRPSSLVVKSATHQGGKEVHLLAQFSWYLGCHSPTAPLCDQNPPGLLGQIPPAALSRASVRGVICRWQQEANGSLLEPRAGRAEGRLDALMVQGRGLGLLGPGTCEKWEWSSGAQLVCTTIYLQIPHPLKQQPAPVCAVTPASLSRESSLLASLGEITDCPAASRKMSLLGWEQWACFLMMGCRHLTSTCLLWAPTLGPAFYLPCNGFAGSGKRECSILKCIMSRRLHAVPIFWLHKTGEKRASCCL